MVDEKNKKYLLEFFERQTVEPLLYFPQISILRISEDQDDPTTMHVRFTAWGTTCNARIRTMNVPESLKNGSQCIFSVLCIVQLVPDSFYKDGYGDARGYNKKFVSTQDLRIICIDPVKNLSDNVF